MTLLLKPQRGGFLRPFGCGEFIRDFLMGTGPYNSERIDPIESAPQAEIFFHYKNALLSARELEVLRLLAADLTNQQIADRLFISWF